MTNAVLAIGTLVQVQDPIALTWATISEVRTINGPDEANDEKDVTNHSSPGGAHERVPTLGDPGQLGFTINFIPNDPTHDQNTGLIYQKRNKTRYSYRMVLPDPGHLTFTFPGFVKDFKMKEPVDDVITADVTLRVISQSAITGT